MSIEFLNLFKPPKKQTKARCQWLAYNPGYSGGRDQEDLGSKPAQANSSTDPMLKKPITKKCWWSGSRCRPWVQTPVPQKKKKKKVVQPLWTAGRHFFKKLNKLFYNQQST
jgi:hypothetical protein